MVPLKMKNETGGFGKTSENYIETIAGQWKRSNIETVEEAMKIAEKKHKKLKKIITNKNEKTTTYKKTESSEPAWFKKEQDIIETTEEDVEELDKILNELI